MKAATLAGISRTATKHTSSLPRTNEGLVKIGKNQVTHQVKRKLDDSEPGHVVSRVT